jgi:hypothetical protein
MWRAVWSWRLAHRKVFTHFLEAFLSDAADGEQIIDTFERAVGFAHLQNFFSSCGTDSRDLLEFFGVRGVDVDGFGWWLFGCAAETLQDKAER